MEDEGFIRNGRRVFAVRYRLTCPPPQIMELVVPLDADGNGVGPTRPAEPAKRLVNAQPGEQIIHDKYTYTVEAVDVYRAARIHD